MFQTIKNIKNTETSLMCRTSEDSLGLSDPLLSSLICNSSLAYPACYPTRGVAATPGKKAAVAAHHNDETSRYALRSNILQHQTRRPCNHLCTGGNTTQVLGKYDSYPSKNRQALSAPRRVALRLRRTWHRRQSSLDSQDVSVSLDGCNTGGNLIMH